MEKQQYIYTIQPVREGMLPDGPTEQEAEVVSRHFAYLKGLTGEGIVLMAGRTLNTDTTSFGIVVLEADSVESARQVMESDPAVAESVMRAEFFPFRTALLTKNRFV